MFPRHIFPALKAHLGRKQITVLTGMRRTGKTTLLQALLQAAATPNSLFLDFQRLRDRELFFENNLDLLLDSMKKRGLDLKKPLTIALDEIQLAPEAVSVIKYLYDHYPIKFLITGSSSFYLKNLFSESLAGRKKIFELFPLNFSEYLTFQEVHATSLRKWKTLFQPHEFSRLTVHYEDFIRYGGFPEVVLAKTELEKRDLLQDTLGSYINVDIKTFADFSHQKIFYDLMKLLASRVGSRLDMMKLSRELGLSRHTVSSYLETLEKTYLITRIPIVARSEDRKVTKAKKLYFNDNGLLNILAELSSGAQFENAVFTQLRHFGDLSYFSLKNGREIDFILDKKIGFEVKERPTSPDLKTLLHLSHQANIKKTCLIGRFPVPHFTEYIWGGEIR